jgi:hemerythrin-like domain-containing protein
MNATTILMDEHRIIEGVLDALEYAADKLEAGDQLPSGYFIEAADFIRGFADGCHHQKEEGVLFKTMNKYGMSNEGGPIAVMLYEHEEGRKFTRNMLAAAERLEAGDHSAREAVVQNAREYVQLLRQHIQKEDQILFPMADQVIPAEQHGVVEAAFEHIEHEETGAGVHEKYLAIAEKLGSIL